MKDIKVQEEKKFLNHIKNVIFLQITSNSILPAIKIIADVNAGNHIRVVQKLIKEAPNLIRKKIKRKP